MLLYLCIRRSSVIEVNVHCTGVVLWLVLYYNIFIIPYLKEKSIKTYLNVNKMLHLLLCILYSYRFFVCKIKVFHKIKCYLIAIDRKHETQNTIR